MRKQRAPNTELTCAICGETGIKRMEKHLRRHHPEHDQQSYYDAFFGRTDCVICGKPTAFHNAINGYKRTCSHSHGSMLFRQEMAADEERQKAFVAKTSANAKAQWADRTDEERKELFKKVGTTAKAKNALLTEEERKERFGWMNKLEDDEREAAIARMKSTGAHAWWANASEEDKLELFEYRALCQRAANAEMSVEEYLERASKPPTREAYYEAVWMHTERNYRRHRDQIDPDLKRGSDWHLDHRFSITRAWAENIPPEIIGSIHNLEILTKEENLRKLTKCSINKEALMELYYGKKLLEGNLSGSE